MTGAGTETDGQVEILPDNGQHKHPAVLAELVVTAVDTILAVSVDDDLCGRGARLGSSSPLSEMKDG